MPAAGPRPWRDGASTAAGNPRTEVWLKKGSGSMVKVVDMSEPNTGPASGSYRYQKAGIYKFDGTFGASSSRSFYRRGWMIAKNEAGATALNESTMMRWLER